MFSLLTDVGQKILDIAKYNVDSQMLFPKHQPCSIHVKELDWFKPVAGNKWTFAMQNPLDHSDSQARLRSAYASR